MGFVYSFVITLESSSMDLRDNFKLIVFQSDGKQYEDLFVKVMTYFIPEFRAVKPHGKIGDRGNDGWVASTGTYYQVYAPEELFTNTEKAQNKVKEDFEKLNSYWNNISKINNFYFVVNDKFKGVSPHIHNTLNEIKNINSLSFCGVFDSCSLEQALFSLSNDVICNILGVSPIQFDPLYEDRKKVRTFLDSLSFVFQELFSSGREAGYFFPSNVFYHISNNFNDEWSFERLRSKNSEIARSQENIVNSLIKMYNHIKCDPCYVDIGISFKYMPPFDMPDRDALIERNKDAIGGFIGMLFESYNNIKTYAA